MKILYYLPLSLLSGLAVLYPVGSSKAQKKAPPIPQNMVLVPGGSFSMGCNQKVDKECDRDEAALRNVKLESFAIDRTEVTTKAYRQCVKAGACTKPKGTFDECNLGKKGRELHPINCVTWHQAKAYCIYQKKRLPSEAEWEKAARGTEGRKYPWGSGKLNCSRAVVPLPIWGCGKETTWPVGSKPAGASPYGALDMIGNVSEWVADWHSKSRGTKVHKGGNWLTSGKEELRASARSYGTPTDAFHALGFRCASSL